MNYEIPHLYKCLKSYVEQGRSNTHRREPGVFWLHIAQTPNMVSQSLQGRGTFRSKVDRLQLKYLKTVI